MQITAVISAHNDNSKAYNLTAVVASLHSPTDYSMYVQNFTHMVRTPGPAAAQRAATAADPLSTVGWPAESRHACACNPSSVGHGRSSMPKLCCAHHRVAGVLQGGAAQPGALS